MPDNGHFEKYLEQRFTNIDLKLDAMQQSVDLKFHLLQQSVDSLRRDVDRRFVDVDRRFDEVVAISTHKFDDLAARINTLQNVGWGIILTFVGALVTLVTVSIRS